MKNMNTLGVVLLFAGLTACHTPPKKLDGIPMMWKPTSEIKLAPGSLNGLLDTKMQFGAFKDVRKNPELVAQNNEDPTPKLVTTHDNIGEFVSTHMREAFDHIGLTTVESGGDVVISGEVRQFFVTETDTYKGNVMLRVSVHNRAGKNVWTGAATGTASRFGHSYSQENYYEVFSDSILSAVAALVQDAEFRAAVARK